MKKLVTAVFTLLAMTIAAQPKGYSTLDYTFEYNTKEFNSHGLKGKIKSLMVYKKGNNNFHTNDLAIKLETGMADCHKYFIKSNQVSKILYLNSNGSLRSKRVYSNGHIQEFEFYVPNNEVIQSRHVFIYNNSGQLIEKSIKEASDRIINSIKYNYDNGNCLESVTGVGDYNYKYIYDGYGGFYDVKYSEYNGQTTIHEVRYNRYSDTESLNILLQNEPKIGFEGIRNLKKSWQTLTKFDNSNRVIFEQSKDLILNEVQIESSFTYNNDSQLFRKTVKSKFGTNDTYFYVYQGNKLIRQFARNQKGAENFNQLLDYNSIGDLIKKHNSGFGIKEEIYTYEYTYDKNQNWVEKKEIVNGKLLEITFRAIEYEELQ